MKSIFQTLAIVALLSTSARADLKIVTTTPEFADLARQIGGAHVTVRSVMKGPENVHNVLATPSEMVQLNQADLFVHGGLDSEPWRDNFLKGARNPRVLPGKPGNVDMSAGIELKDVPTGKIDRSMGDVHAFGNPHFQLNPANAQRMTATLTRAMCEVDPSNADVYRDNAKRFVNELADIAKEMRERFKPYEGLKVVTFHPAWKYLADAIPIQIVGTIEPKPSITPSPAQVRETIDLMKRENVKVVIVETYSDASLAKRIADAAGATLVRLPDHVLGVPEVDTYPKLFRHITDKLLAAANSRPTSSAPPSFPSPGTPGEGQGGGEHKG
jgi:zinc/manganese transport system substrate-binding protein